MDATISPPALPPRKLSAVHLSLPEIVFKGPEGNQDDLTVTDLTDSVYDGLSGIEVEASETKAHGHEDQGHDDHATKISKMSLLEALATLPKSSLSLLSELQPFFRALDAVDDILSWKNASATYTFWICFAAACVFVPGWFVLVQLPYLSAVSVLCVGWLMKESEGSKTTTPHHADSRKSKMSAVSKRTTLRFIRWSKRLKPLRNYLSLTKMILYWDHPPSSRLVLRTVLASYIPWVASCSVTSRYPRFVVLLVGSAVILWDSPISKNTRSSIVKTEFYRRLISAAKAAWTWWAIDHGFVVASNGEHHPDFNGKSEAPLSKLDGLRARGKAYGKAAFQKTLKAWHGSTGTLAEDFHAAIPGMSTRENDLKRRKTSDDVDAQQHHHHHHHRHAASESYNDSPPSPRTVLTSKDLTVRENQRWWFGLDWVPLMVPLRDPPAWCDMDGGPTCSPMEHFIFPPVPSEYSHEGNFDGSSSSPPRLAWRWLEPKWTATDWEYSDNFWSRENAASHAFPSSSPYSSHGDLLQRGSPAPISPTGSTLSFRSTSPASSLLSAPAIGRTRRKSISDMFVSPLKKIKKKTTRTRSWSRKAGLVVLH